MLLMAREEHEARMTISLHLNGRRRDRREG